MTPDFHSFWRLYELEGLGCPLFRFARSSKGFGDQVFSVVTFEPSIAVFSRMNWNFSCFFAFAESAVTLPLL